MYLIQWIWTCLNLTTQLYLNGFTYTNTVHNTEVRAERRTEEDSRDEIWREVKKFKVKKYHLKVRQIMTLSCIVSSEALLWI